MGLREHEFDVAPELMAALARGTPGPLLDRAMAHGVNVAEAAAALRESEENARVQAEASSVEAAVEAALHGVDAAIGSVRDRGAFDDGNVGGTTEGPSDVTAGLTGSISGPGSRRGQQGKWQGRLGGRLNRLGVPFSLIEGVIDFSSFGGGAVSQGGEFRGRTEAEWRQHRDALWQTARQLQREHRAAGLNNEPEEVQNKLENAYTETFNEFERVSRYIREHFRTPRRAQYDTPDGPDNDGPFTRVDYWLLYQWLKSMGGLGVRQDVARDKGAQRPKIMDATDPSPDSESSTSVSGEVRYWQFNLIDPTPEPI